MEAPLSCLSAACCTACGTSELLMLSSFSLSPCPYAVTPKASPALIATMVNNFGVFMVLVFDRLVSKSVRRSTVGSGGKFSHQQGVARHNKMKNHFAVA